MFGSQSLTPVVLTSLTLENILSNMHEEVEAEDGHSANQPHLEKKHRLLEESCEEMARAGVKERLHRSCGGPGQGYQYLHLVGTEYSVSS